MEKIQTQGVAIPRLGFGTFRMPGGGCQPVVESALGLGYRHLDTAAMYENEDAVGAAVESQRADALTLECTQLSGGTHVRSNRDHRKGGRHGRPDAPRGGQEGPRRGARRSKR